MINCFSTTLLSALLVKIKTVQEIINTIEKILQEKSPRTNHQSDAGLNFFNQNFKKLMKKYNVNNYNIYSKKAIEVRVDRTLKNLSWGEFNFHGHYKFLDTYLKN